MMATQHVEAILADLKRRIDGDGIALVSRNGTLVSADLPAGVLAEAFAVMCATIFGAAATANSEIGRGCPEQVVIDGGGSTMILRASGPGAVLVAVVEPPSDVGLALREVARFADLVRVG